MPPNNIFARGNVMSAEIDGLIEAQEAIDKIAKNVSKEGMRGELEKVLDRLRKYARSVVHVDTSRLRNSIFTDIESGGNSLIGHVATNIEYSVFEEARGGDHAFFGRTVEDEGPRAANDLFKIVTNF